MRARNVVILVSFLFLAIGLAGGQNAEPVPELSPYPLTGPGTPAYGTGPRSPDAPFASSRNVALDAVLSRFSLGAYSAGLLGLGDTGGVGWTAGLGGRYPTDWGVLGGSLHLSALGENLAYEDSGWYLGSRLSFAKALYGNFFAGVAINVEGGRGGDPSWGLSADLGVYHRLGSWAFLQDIWWAASLERLGKGFRWTGSDIYAPEIFTPRLSLGARLLEAEQAELDLSLDLSFPRFGNLRFLADLYLVTGPGITAGLGYSFDLDRLRRETGSGLPVSLSFGYRFTPGYDEDFGATELDPPRRYAGLPYEGCYGELYGTPVHRNLLITGEYAVPSPLTRSVAVRSWFGLMPSRPSTSRRTTTEHGTSWR